MNKRELGRTILYCSALGVMVVAVACLALDWLRSPAADWFWKFWNK